jgi:hypothetical protein
MSLPASVPNPGPLSDAHLRQLADARDAAKGVRRVVGVARMSAWTTGILGGCTLLGVLFGDLTSLVLGAALVAISVREHHLSTRLARFDADAPRRLATNQLILGGVLVAYAAWQFLGAYRSNGLSGGSQPIGDAQVDRMLGEIGDLTRRVMMGFYVAVALGGAAGPALMSLYYRRARSRLAAFVDRTPTWITQTLRAAA